MPPRGFRKEFGAVIVTVGRIVRAHGVRGEAVVEVRTDAPEERFVPGATLRVWRPRPPRHVPPGHALPELLTIQQARWHQGRLLVRFEGVTDRDAAEQLRGVRLQVEIADDAPPPDDDEFFDHQLVGLRVYTDDGDVVGEVTEIIHAPGQDLLVVGRSGGGEVLVPFVGEIVSDVDLTGGRVSVTPPPGLLDLEADAKRPREDGRRGGGASE